jgi:hypothetical protein
MLKLELYWRGVPRGVALFDEPPRAPAEWGLARVSRVEGGFALTAESGRCMRVRHGDSARLNNGPFTLVASSVVAWSAPARSRVSDWPWLFIALLVAASSSFAAFASLAPEVEAPEGRRDPDFLRRVTFLPALPRPFPKRPPVLHACPCGGCIRPAGCTPIACPPRPPRRIPPLIKEAPALRELDRMLPLEKLSAVVPGQLRASPLRVGRDGIVKVLQAHAVEIVACHQRAVLRDRVVAKTLRVEWTLDDSGQARHAKANLVGANSAAFAACVLDRLEKWRFPRVPGGAVISYPFRVEPVSH